MLSLYQKIKNCLENLHSSPLQGHAAKRLNTLSGLTTGMIRKGSSHLPAIGSGIAKNIDSHSKTIAATRFIDNKWTDEQTHFLPYLKTFLQDVVCQANDLQQDICLVIDGSQVGKHNAVLMISMFWESRGIPICWFVKQGSKGHFKTQDHIYVLHKAIKRLENILPQDLDLAVTLLGDGEFDSIALQELCLEHGWNYVLRTACNTVLYKGDERFKAGDIRPESSHDSYMIDQVDFTNERFKSINFVCWHDKNKHEDPIFLISNLPCSRQIIDYYDQRYSIECLFKDLKTTSFNLHKTRLKKTSNVNNLIMVAALAFLLLTVLAITYDQPMWRKKVQRVRKDQKVLSFFTFACLLLEFFIDNDLAFQFSFQFAKKNNNFF